MKLERKTCTVSYVVNISFVMAVLKSVSDDDMKELVIVKNLHYSDVINMLQEKNSDAKGISKTSAMRLDTSNNIRKQSNLSKEEF